MYYQYYVLSLQSNLKTINDMDTMEIMIDTKVYAVINTTDYNEDGTASVQIAIGLEGANELGWQKNALGYNLYTREIIEVADLKVGDIMESEDFVGAFIMRIA